jgi:predicted ferric reductase
LLVTPVPKGGGYAWDFAMALGFGGLAVMGLQFVLTARFRHATAPFGIDVIYYFHRWAAIGAFVLLLTHYLILRIRYGATLGTVNPLTAPWHMSAGRCGLVIFALLLVTSLWRKALRLEYDRWRMTHGLMAMAAGVLAIAHIIGVGYYTRAPWKGVVWIGYSVSWVLVLGYIRVVKPLRLLRHPYQVAAVKTERGGSWSLVLKPERPPPLSFRPGQFAWLSIGTSPIQGREHPFSFSGSADDPGTLRFTIKELGDFTRTIKHVRIGEIAYVDGPYGVFTTDLHPTASGFVLVAGGVGIAPIMSILRTLADRGDPRPVHLIYGNWRWDGVLFREDIEILKTRLKLSVTHVLQEPPSPWNGETGFVTEALLRRTLPNEAGAFVYFLCGPKAMTDFVLPSLRRIGVPLHRIHFELFEMA